jgi:hypothetical protein
MILGITLSPIIPRHSKLHEENLVYRYQALSQPFKRMSTIFVHFFSFPFPFPFVVLLMSFQSCSLTLLGLSLKFRPSRLALLFILLATPSLP